MGRSLARALRGAVCLGAVGATSGAASPPVARPVPTTGEALAALTGDRDSAVDAARNWEMLRASLAHAAPDDLVATASALTTGATTIASGSFAANEGAVRARGALAIPSSAGNGTGDDATLVAAQEADRRAVDDAFSAALATRSAVEDREIVIARDPSLKAVLDTAVRAAELQQSAGFASAALEASQHAWGSAPLPTDGQLTEVLDVVARLDAFSRAYASLPPCVAALPETEAGCQTLARNIGRARTFLTLSLPDILRSHAEQLRALGARPEDLAPLAAHLGAGDLIEAAIVHDALVRAVTARSP